MATETICAPIPGKLIAVKVKPGDTVKEGAVVCTLESMKMQNPILSPVSGTVKEVKVVPGQAVKGGAPMVVVEY